MNVDDAIEEARQFGEQESKDMLFAEHIAILLATEVERLRAELAKANAGLAMVEATVSENELLRAMNERLAADLVAAKAASVCPVEIQSVYVNKYLGSVVVFIGNEPGAVEFDAWLCDRVKERGEQ